MCDGDIHQSLFAIGMCDLKVAKVLFYGEK